MLRSRLVKIADNAYPDGMIAQVFETIHAERSPDECGDSLATFIVRELIDTYDPDADDRQQLSEAQRVMYAAHTELGRVLVAFEEALIMHGCGQIKLTDAP